MVAKWLLVLLLGVVFCGRAPAQTGTDPAHLAARSVNGNGQRVRPLAPAGSGRRATVLLFAAHDCPISNGYAPEVNRIVAEYAPRGVAFYLVYVEPGLSPAVARKHVSEFGYRCPALLDGRHVLVKHAGASVTPEAAVYLPGGARAYRGRIDDRYPALGRRREHVTTRDLRAALDAVLAGRPVPAPTTKSIGCFIAPVAAAAAGEPR